MSRALVELIDITVRYRSGPPWARREVTAVDRVTLHVAAGEVLGLVGESGSGKTTLGRLCLGLLTPTAGRARFDDAPMAARGASRGRISVVLQQPEWALNPRLRIGVSVAEPVAVQGGEDRAGRARRVAEALSMVGLDPSMAARYPHELSGGQRQRVAIARALITRPRFVVFDEAVSALDVSVQTQVLNLIKDLQRDTGFAALFISHDLAATRYVSDRIAVMQTGRIVEEGPVARFYDRPHHPYSQSLFDTVS